MNCSLHSPSTGVLALSAKAALSIPGLLVWYASRPLIWREHEIKSSIALALTTISHSQMLCKGGDSICIQENVGAGAALDNSGKIAPAWSSGLAKSNAKKVLATSTVKVPLQPSQLVNKANVDHASWKMGPPPPKKPPTQEQIAHAQVGRIPLMPLSFY